MTPRIDVAIIGAGTFGMGAYRAARAHTENLLLIEGAQYGTTCARVGCMPSKLLIAAAEAAHDVANASRFGVRVEGTVRVDGREVMARVRRERDRFVGFVVEAVEEWPPETRIKGRAQFLDDHTLALGGGERVEADRIVIATGSRTNQPAEFAALGDRMIVNDDVFDWEDLPGSVAVFGAGVIGLDFTGTFAALGTGPDLGRGGAVALLTDPEVRGAMLAAMRDGLDFDPDAKVASVSREKDSVVVRFCDDDAETDERFDYLLAATGRRANVDGLGLRTPHSTWTSAAYRGSTASRCSAATPTSSSPVTSTATSRCCTRRPIRAGLPGRTPAASPMFAPGCAARR